MNRKERRKERTKESRTADTLFMEGLKAQQQGERNKAIALYQKALQTFPHHQASLNNLAIMYFEEGKVAETEHIYRLLIKLDVHNPLAWNNMGVILRERDKTEEALPYLEQALRLHPGYLDAIGNIASVYGALGNFTESLAYCEKVKQLRGDYTGVHNTRGVALLGLNEVEEAAAMFVKAITEKPEDAVAHKNLGITYLLLGKFTEGLKEYEWRWKVKEMQRDVRRIHIPAWQGETLQGKTLLLYCEQGYGDSIQCIRFVPQLKALGARIFLECPPELVALFQNVAGVEKIIPRGAPLPPFDTHTSLLDVLYRLQVTEKTIPATVPYLVANPGLVPLPLQPGKKHIGLVWAGNKDHNNDRNRSIAFKMLAPLLEKNHCAFYSLQVGKRAEAMRQSKYHESIVDMAPYLKTFAHTAAVIAQLDEVISVDTAVAHLAGALGKPVWLLLPFAPDWRWGLKREDSPWYPTMRLFRQPKLNDWESVIERVASEIVKP